MWPDGPDGSKGPTSWPSALFSLLPRPGEIPCSSLKCSPRRAAAQPARRHRRRQRPWTRRRVLLVLLFSPALTRAHTARGSVRRTLATARGATPSPGARRVSPVRAKPWARWGAAGRVIRSHAPAETSARLKAGAAQNGRRRGTTARAVHRAAEPRPWRAWVRPAGARAHLHLHQHIHGTKAGFTAAQNTAKRARLTSGLAARHALGAAHDGAAHSDAARGCFPALPAEATRPPKRRLLWDVTAWGSHDPRLPLVQRNAARRGVTHGEAAARALGQRRLEGSHTGSSTKATGARRRER
jgi:hypothetical protein